jgi:hypothetical protein
MKDLKITVTERRLADELTPMGSGSSGGNCAHCGGGCSCSCEGPKQKYRHSIPVSQRQQK